jgi:HK97 family phage prohead protease
MKHRASPGVIERRDIRSAKPDVTDDGKIRGLAIPFEQWTTIGAGKLSFRERVATGAVTKTFQEGDVVLLDNHDPAKPIARKSAGTLEMRVGAEGARYEAEPADTTYARDAVVNIRAKNYGGMSFGFEVVKEKWDIGEDGVDERTLLEIKAPEISICTFPAYDGTEVGMRDAYAAGIEARDRYYESRGGDAPGDGSKPYGDVPYADPGYQKDKKKRYPIDTKKHVQAAWSYINKAKNAAAYTASQLSAIKAKIKAAAKKFGITISSDRSFADFELRGYDPVTGFETRDDPDGHEVAAIEEALAKLAAGDAEGARELLQECLDNYDEGDEGDDETEDSSGMVAHTTQGGSAVPVRQDETPVEVRLDGLQKAAELLSELTPNARTKEAKNLLESVVAALEPRTLQRAYDLIRSLTPTTQSNEALSILEPLIDSAETAAEERQQSKPERPSTSAVTRDSKEGRELAKKFEALQHAHRP